MFPRKGGRVWYDDQRHVHRQIFTGEEVLDYAFLGTINLLPPVDLPPGPARPMPAQDSHGRMDLRKHWLTTTG